jgi:hypothetical protein
MTKARDIASATPAPSTVSATEIGYLDGVSSAIQTQLDDKTAKSTLTTTGDIYYASSANTPARLGIGSTGNVLTVASGIPSWAAASSGALTKIASDTFSNVASVTVDTVFSSTYKSYILNVMAYSNTADTADLYFRFRNNTPATITAGYSAGGQKIIRSGTVSAMVSDDATQWLLTTDMGSDADSKTVVTINIGGITGSTERPNFYMMGSSSPATPGLFVMAGGKCTGANVRGFILSASTGNITGDYQLYGLEK